MANRREKRSTKLNRIVFLLVGAVVAFCVLASMEEKHGLPIGFPQLELPSLDSLYDFIDNIGNPSQDSMENAVAVSTAPGEIGLEVHVLDVGQGMSVLVRGPNKDVLIDAGENNKGAGVIRYLQERGVEDIDILIGTHPHSDHIGGMDTVIRGLPAGMIVLPEIPDAIVPVTKTYTDLLEAILEKQLPVEKAEPGKQYSLGKGATLTILGPTDAYDDLNDMSIIGRVTYGDTSFVFTGDACTRAESGVVQSGRDMQGDVLLVGHHGSNTSSSQPFLDAVSPSIALVSCGLDNSYGHPHREVVEKLQAMGAAIYRTDLQGNLVVYSDGKNWTVEMSAA